jgi:deoxyribose-phosphate aldolase
LKRRPLETIKGIQTIKNYEMKISQRLNDKYGPGESQNEVDKRTDEILKAGKELFTSAEMMARALSCIDLTSLNPSDNEEVARKMCDSINNFSSEFPGLENVAAICIYPALLYEVKKNLKAPGVHIAAVGAGFPASQTFLSIKLAECELIASKGADEIDIVISLGKFLAGRYQYVADEISLIKEAIEDTHLKVILETGKLGTPDNIRAASLLALESGADFIKTSTGKESPAATPGAVYVMANAIRDYYRSTGRKAGIKPAGGIASPEDAAAYMCIVSEILGDDWLKKDLFRIGASRLANNLLGKILGKEVKFF